MPEVPKSILGIVSKDSQAPPVTDEMHPATVKKIQVSKVIQGGIAESDHEISLFTLTYWVA